MFINLYESLLKGKPVYALIFIRICEAMLTALTKQDSGKREHRVNNIARTTLFIGKIEKKLGEDNGKKKTKNTK
jgi:hypothetical protein